MALDVQFMANNINNNLAELPASEIENIRNIDIIVFTYQVETRTFTEESSGTWYLSLSDYYGGAGNGAGPVYLSSSLAHEGGHVEFYLDAGRDINASRGLEVELKLTRDQIDIGEILNLTQDQINELQDLIDNQNILEQRLNEDPFIGGEQPAAPPAAFAPSTPDISYLATYPVYSQADFSAFGGGGGGGGGGNEWIP